MWYVISTPHPNDENEEEIWECPSNWVINNIVFYPNNKGSRRSLLDQIKRKDEPQPDWFKTTAFKFIKNKDGISTFGKFEES